MIPFHFADHNVVFIANGKPYNVAVDHPNFDKIRHGLLAGDLDATTLIELAHIPTAISKSSAGRITIQGSQVFFKGNPLHNVWTEKLVGFMNAKLPYAPIFLALESLFRNPSFMARERLPLFQEENQLGFLPDGRLTALKAVRSNWKDKHSNTIDNSIGKIIIMPREEISDDPDIHCHYGLHAGSWSYVANFGSRSEGDRVILVAFAAEDVVSVPRDLTSKLRVCQYEVLDELSWEAVDEFISRNQLIVNYEEDDDNLVDEEDDTYYGR